MRASENPVTFEKCWLFLPKLHSASFLPARLKHTFCPYDIKDSTG